MTFELSITKINELLSIQMKEFDAIKELVKHNKSFYLGNDLYVIDFDDGSHLYYSMSFCEDDILEYMKVDPNDKMHLSVYNDLMIEGSKENAKWLIHEHINRFGQIILADSDGQFNVDLLIEFSKENNQYAYSICDGDKKVKDLDCFELENWYQDGDSDPDIKTQELRISKK